MRDFFGSESLVVLPDHIAHVGVLHFVDHFAGGDGFDATWFSLREVLW